MNVSESIFKEISINGLSIDLIKVCHFFPNTSRTYLKIHVKKNFTIITKPISEFEFIILKGYNFQDFLSTLKGKGLIKKSDIKKFTQLQNWTK